MSDRPTHFKDNTIRLVSKGLKVLHYFTLPYCPWSNGAVERLCCELICFLCSSLLELQKNHQKWPNLISIVHTVFNNSSSQQRGSVCPITAFRGFKPTPPVKTSLCLATDHLLTLMEAQLKSSNNIEEPEKFCAELHPHVHADLDRYRAHHRTSASHGRLPNFREGGYILIVRSDFHTYEKL